LRRAPRLVEFHSRDKANPRLEEVFDAVPETWESPYGRGCAAKIGKVVDDVALHDWMSLAANEHGQRSSENDCRT
jgi:hypothetical protein